MPLYSIETYGELQPSLSQEWLLTNGLGGAEDDAQPRRRIR